MATKSMESNHPPPVKAQLSRSDSCTLAGFWWGPIGLGLMNLLCSVLLVFGFFFDRSSQAFSPARLGYAGLGYVPTMLIGQTLLIPFLVVIFFTVVTPLLWYGAMHLRSLIAIIAILPGSIAFFFTMMMVGQSIDLDELVQLVANYIALVVGSASVAIGIGMWSRWALTHLREDPEQSSPMSIRSIMVQTTMLALVFAFCISWTSELQWDHIISTVVVGGIGAAGIVGILLSLLSDNPSPPKKARLIVFALILVIVGSLNNLIAMSFSGSKTVSTLSVGCTTLYGAAVWMIAVEVCLSWIRQCGWRRIHRRKTVLPSPVKDSMGLDAPVPSSQV